MTQIDPSSIVFLIRSYNEATRILGVIESISDAGFSQILVIDDGSSDGTESLLRPYREGIVYIRHLMNRGGGAALETGFEFIRRSGVKHGWEYVVTFDADGQHTIDDIDQFLGAFEKQPELDVVIGSRFITKTNTNVPWTRRLILWGGKLFTSVVSGIHLTDTHNGYRMFRINVIQNIRLTLDGMEYASELLDRIQSGGFRYMEVPVNIHYDEYTLAKGQRFGGVFRVAFRFLYKKIFHS